MKKNVLFLWLIATVLCQALVPNDCCDEVTSNCEPFAKNLWQPRAFSSYGSREIYHLKDLYDHPFKQDAWDGTFSASIEYMQSSENNNGSTNLGAMPFWSGTNSMTIGTNNGKSDVDAYQFGMGNAIKQGEITLNPRVQQVGTELLLHFTQYKHDRGAFFKIKVPFGAMQIHSKLCEDAAQLDHAVDDAWQLYPAPSNRYDSLSQAFAGGSTSADAVVSSSLHKPLALEYGRISCCKLSSARVGDLSATAGYNIFADENYFLGAGFKLSFPTGTIPTGKFIFEPIFGRTGLWGIGLDITGHYKWLFKICSREAELDVWLQSEVSHLTSGRQPSWRSFDLKKNGPGSKYMLVQFYLPTNPEVAPGNTLGRSPSFITQAVNITTLPVLSSFSLEGSASALFELTMQNWNAALGFEVWGRTSECLQIDTCNMVNHNSANLNDFAVLGRQISEDDATNNPATEPLYYCEPEAKINKSIDRVLFGKPVPSGVKDARLGANRIPAVLSDALDIAGAAETKSFSGRIIGSVGHSWTNRHLSPCVNLFAGIELCKFNPARLNMWSIGLQGALNF